MGASLRYLASQGGSSLWGSRGEALATLAVNVAGCFLAIALMQTVGRQDPQRFYLLVVGFCGSLTTFSAFSLETLALAHQGRTGPAIVFALANLLGSLLAAAWAWKIFTPQSV